MTTIKDIAKLAQVSIGTVSAVLNNKNSSIKFSSQTRKKVLSAADKLKYVPNVMARGLKNGKSYLVGVAVKNMITRSFFPLIVQGIEDALNRSGYSMILCTYNDFEDCEQKIKFLSQKKVDGVIAFADADSYFTTIYKNLALGGTPVVGLCHGSVVQGVPGVYVDGGKIGTIAADYLLKLGHRSILVADCGREKFLDSFKQVFERHNEEFNELYYIPNLYTFDDGREILRLIKKRKWPVTAIVAYNDIMAAGVIYEAKELGIQIPGDISVIGIDNLQVSEMVNPKITTVAQPQQEQGGKAVETILALIDGSTDVCDCIMEPFIVERDSCRENHYSKSGIAATAVS